MNTTAPIFPLLSRYAPIIYKIAALRFEKSQGEVCHGPVTNNEVTSARPLSDFWLARVA